MKPFKGDVTKHSSQKFEASDQVYFSPTQLANHPLSDLSNIWQLCYAKKEIYELSISKDKETASAIQSED